MTPTHPEQRGPLSLERSYQLERKLSRRRSVVNMTCLVAALGLIGGWPSKTITAPRNKSLPRPQPSGIEHGVVMMENQRAGVPQMTHPLVTADQPRR
jgi:hypothetical protein